MTTAMAPATSPTGLPGRDRPSAVGALLRSWREQRRLSQLALACEADVSTRHLSCVETGRARPSRQFLLHVAEHLEVPLPARNELLLAAGYAPVYRRTDLDAPELAPMREAIELVLTHAEPFPALVVDRHWNLVRANAGLALLVDEVDSALLAPPANVLRATLHPNGMARLIEGFGAYSAWVLATLKREAATYADPFLADLHDELAGYPGVQTRLDEPRGVVLPVTLRTPIGRLSLFTTIARFGTASDVTLAELSIESFYPADARTDELVRGAAARARTG